MSFFKDCGRVFFPVGRAPSRAVMLMVIGWFVGGLAVFMGAIFSVETCHSMNARAAEIVFSLMLVAASVLISLSALPWHHESTSWRLELAGWPVALFSWLLHASIILTTDWTSLFSLILSLSFAAASIQRWLEAKQYIAGTRASLASLGNLIGGKDD